MPDFEFGRQYHWASEVLSSEILLAAGPILLAKASGAHVFNIRWLGAVHAALLVAAFYALLVYLRRYGTMVQVAAGALALWIFGDVAYVSYCNSFYSDAATMLGLLLVVPLALLVAAEATAGRVWLFAAAAALFVTSKPQHGLWGFLLALFALVVMRRPVICALLLCAEVAVFWLSPAGYQADPLFTVIFRKLLPGAADRASALRELGLEESDARWIGRHAYVPDSPMLDAEWRAAFIRRASYRRVAAYWVRHPGEALAAMDRDLRVNAPMIRAPDLSNFRREDGHPPGARTNRFASWSNLRAWLYVRWPYHVIAWYALLLGGCVVVWRRRPAARWAVAICLGVAAMAMLEFAFATLTDAAETWRHLLLFHVLTDVTVLWAAIFAAGWRSGRA